MEVAMATRNPVSTANIFGHPIHPMLIPFPIAFFVSALLCDLVFWGTRYDIWATAALWLLGAGLIMAALAAVAGLTDFIGDRRIRELNDVWYHGIGNVIAVLIQLFSFYERYRYGTSVVLPIGLICSAIVVCILLFTGWKGWEMVYRHRVAVRDEPRPASSVQPESPRRAA
jgi:uncharacterized membrane protein